MGRLFWGLLAAAVLAAGGCGQKAERSGDASQTVPAAGTEQAAQSDEAASDEVASDTEEPAQTAESATEVEQADLQAGPPPPGESGHTIGKAAAGAAIAAKVKTTLISLTVEEGLATENLDVEAKADGTVTLSGSVPSEEQKERIEEAALEVEGVRAVENALTLAP